MVQCVLVRPLVIERETKDNIVLYENIYYLPKIDGLDLNAPSRNQ